MTKKNSKKLYDHYVEIGRDDAAANMLKKYPEFKGAEKAEKPKVEEKEKSKKKKGV